MKETWGTYEKLEWGVAPAKADDGATARAASEVKCHNARTMGNMIAFHWPGLARPGPFPLPPSFQVERGTNHHTIIMSSRHVVCVHVRLQAGAAAGTRPQEAGVGQRQLWGMGWRTACSRQSTADRIGACMLQASLFRSFMEEEHTGLVAGEDKRLGQVRGKRQGQAWATRRSWQKGYKVLSLSLSSPPPEGVWALSWIMNRLHRHEKGEEGRRIVPSTHPCLHPPPSESTHKLPNGIKTRHGHKCYTATGGKGKREGQKGIHGHVCWKVQLWGNVREQMP